MSSVSDTTYSTQTNAMNRLLAQIATALASVAVIPAPSAGAVGTYLMAKCSSTVALGGRVAGSALTPTDSTGAGAGAAPAGTWQCMGTTSAANQVSLFSRVS